MSRNDLLVRVKESLEALQRDILDRFSINLVNNKHFQDVIQTLLRFGDDESITSSDDEQHQQMMRELREQFQTIENYKVQIFEIGQQNKLIAELAGRHEPAEEVQQLQSQLFEYKESNERKAKRIERKVHENHRTIKEIQRYMTRRRNRVVDTSGTSTEGQMIRSIDRLDDEIQDLTGKIRRLLN